MYPIYAVLYIPNDSKQQGSSLGFRPEIISIKANEPWSFLRVAVLQCILKSPPKEVLSLALV